jgi:hypothetical protein
MDLKGLLSQGGLFFDLEVGTQKSFLHRRRSISRKEKREIPEDPINSVPDVSYFLFFSVPPGRVTIG